MAVIRNNSIDGITHLTAEGSTIEFRKPDGSEFEYDVLKLSKPDRAMIKKVLVQEGRIIE